jgi:hypothetical protein
MSNRCALAGSVIVAAHLAVSLFHRTAHEHLHIGLSPIQTSFVVIVILIGPLVAAALLWTRWPRAGALLLALSMAGSLAFGVYYHFVEISPDHVSQVPEETWGTVFRATAVLLAMLEGAGAIVGAWLLIRGWLGSE